MIGGRPLAALHFALLPSLAPLETGAGPCNSTQPSLAPRRPTSRCRAAAGEVPEKKCMSGWVRVTSRSICSSTSASWGASVWQHARSDCGCAVGAREGGRR